MTPDEVLLRKHWSVFSRELDALLDQPAGERPAWLAGRGLEPEVFALLSRALDHAEHSPLDAGVFESEDRATPWRRQLGAWRILRPLGEGGSASVFLAERTESGFRLEAALKLLRTGVLDPVERARFAFERELLAGLRHPGIARLIDGGVSPEGAPFLVIEHVDGEPITSWCLRKRLPLDARIALLQDACDAVSYAHRNLIVHRDLKPGNIMVDAEGHVKLLDFGIARVVDDTRAATRTDARRLTPAYAAPEQLEGGPVTTAIDVYAMGVLLHELATGRLPGNGAAGPRFARSGDLRWAWVDAGPVDRAMMAIIENAIDIDPDRRYGSVAALAEDLERYRNGLTVRARGISHWYRLGRSLRRHWGLISATALVLGVVSAAALVARNEAEAARRVAAREAATRAFLVDLLASASPEQAAGKPVDVAELVALGATRAGQAFPDAPESRAELLSVSGRLLATLGRYEHAERTLRHAHSIELGLRGWEELGRPETRLALATVLRDRNRPTEAGQLLAPLIEHLRREDAGSMVLGEALLLDGAMRARAGEHDAGIERLQEGLALIRGGTGVLPERIADSERQLGEALARAGRFEQALASWNSAKSRIAPDTVLRARIQLAVGYVEQARNQFQAAGQAFHEALAIQRKLLPPDHTDTSQTLTALAVLASALGDEHQALEHHQAALRMRETVFGVHSVEAAESQVGVAVTLTALERFDEAFAGFRSGIRRLEQSTEPPIVQQAWAWTNYAAAQRKAGLPADAVQSAERASALVRKRFPPDNELRLSFELELVRSLRGQGRFRECADLIRENEAVVQHPGLKQRYRIARAELARVQGDLAQAIADFRSVTETEVPRHNPADHAEAWRGLALSYREAGRSAESAEARAKALDLFAVLLPEGHPRWAKLRAE